MKKYTKEEFIADTIIFVSNHWKKIVLVGGVIMFGKICYKTGYNDCLEDVVREIF